MASQSTRPIDAYNGLRVADTSNDSFFNVKGEVSVTETLGFVVSKSLSTNEGPTFTIPVPSTPITFTLNSEGQLTSVAAELPIGPHFLYGSLASVSVGANFQTGYPIFEVGGRLLVIQLNVQISAGPGMIGHIDAFERDLQSYFERLDNELRTWMSTGGDGTSLNGTYYYSNGLDYVGFLGIGSLKIDDTRKIKAQF